MDRITRALNIMNQKIQREGMASAVKRGRQAIIDKRAAHTASKRNPDPVQFCDVMFVNGCDYSVPHPVRYRVDHQAEQLESVGITCDRVDAWNMDPKKTVAMARSFIIFRCPWAPNVGELIRLAKQLNKKVYYDIDDLVVDRKYTDTIPYLATMSPEERAQYDDGVDRMGRTLKECGCAITTTEALARELRTIVPEVFINRNVASEHMVYFSEKALYERDILPHLDRSQVSKEEMRHWEWTKEQERIRQEGPIKIGYFSGSITHNDDFDSIKEAIKDVMRERPNVHLIIVGDLDIPQDMQEFSSRIEAAPFTEWRNLPQLIASVDINIAPLTRTIFNEAKSENKWVEAALVKVPTVATDFGAFSHEVKDGEAGLLCSSIEGWHKALIDLIDDREMRQRIGQAAYDEAMEHRITIKTGGNLGAFIRKNQTPNVFFELPSLNISGGVLVALRHACILQDAGIDVTCIDNSMHYKDKLFEANGHQLPVVHLKSPKNQDGKIILRGRIDQGVATLWDTVYPLKEYQNIGQISYLVQNYEAGFYPPAHPCRIPCNSTYSMSGVKYLTISKWCRRWLEEEFNRDVRYVPNGIDCTSYPVVDRDFSEGKIRILVEGDSASTYKNVDEAFHIIDLLDPERYEIWYMSYNGKPKEEYRVDRFFHKVPHEEVGTIYSQCHILLKTSTLESFSYPPLEMMATGGYVVVVPNDGNAEYIKDRDNCLTYEQGDLAAAVKCIEEIVDDGGLRKKLREGGLRTAHERDWESIQGQVVELYR